MPRFGKGGKRCRQTPCPARLRSLLPTGRRILGELWLNIRTTNSAICDIGEAMVRSRNICVWTPQLIVRTAVSSARQLCLIIWAPSQRTIEWEGRLSTLCMKRLLHESKDCTEACQEKKTKYVKDDKQIQGSERYPDRNNKLRQKSAESLAKMVNQNRPHGLYMNVPVFSKIEKPLVYKNKKTKSRYPSDNLCRESARLHV